MGGCQNYGPFLGTLNIRGRIMIGTQKGTIILTTTHMLDEVLQGMRLQSEDGGRVGSCFIPTTLRG